MSIWTIITEKPQTPIPTTPPSRKKRRGLVGLLAMVAIALVAIVGVILSRGDPREAEVLGVTVTTPVVTAPTIPPTTTPPPTTAAPTTTTTTTTTVPPTPPASGFYIVPEPFYGTGVPVYGKDIGYPEIGFAYVLFDLPVGTEIYTPFAGELNKTGMVYRRGQSIPAATVYVGDPRIAFAMVGNGLEFREPDSPFTTVEDGELVATVVRPGKVYLSIERYNEKIRMNMPDEELVMEYFSYLVIEPNASS